MNIFDPNIDYSDPEDPIAKGIWDHIEQAGIQPDLSHMEHGPQSKAEHTVIATSMYLATQSDEVLKVLGSNPLNIYFKNSLETEIYGQKTSGYSKGLSISGPFNSFKINLVSENVIFDLEQAHTSAYITKGGTQITSSPLRIGIHEILHRDDLLHDGYKVDKLPLATSAIASLLKEGLIDINDPGNVDGFIDQLNRIDDPAAYQAYLRQNGIEPEFDGSRQSEFLLINEQFTTLRTNMALKQIEQNTGLIKYVPSFEKSLYTAGGERSDMGPYNPEKLLTRVQNPTKLVFDEKNEINNGEAALKSVGSFSVLKN